MTSELSYPQNTTEATTLDGESAANSAFLPPERRERVDSLGRQRSWAAPLHNDGAVRRGTAHKGAARQLERLRIERALESEVLHAAAVGPLEIGIRPDRLTAAPGMILSAVICYFKEFGLTAANLQATTTSREQTITSYARRLMFELAIRHCTMSAHRFSRWFGVDHSSLFHARDKLRVELATVNIVSRATLSDLNGITAILAKEAGWDKVDNISATILRLARYAIEIEIERPSIAVELNKLIRFAQKSMQP